MTRRTKPAKETKREAFIRIGEARVKVLIKAIRTLGNLSNKNAYEYGQGDIEAIIAALDAEIADFRKRMENRKRPMGFSFSLGEDDAGEQTAA